MDSSSPLSSIPASTVSSPVALSLRPSVASSPLSNVSNVSNVSDLSRTPSLSSSPVLAADASRRYPSPMSATPSGTQSPIKLGEALRHGDGDDAAARHKKRAEDDDPRPAKKRKTAPPKERTTAYLNLLKPQDDFSHEDNFHMERLLSALRKKKKIVVIAGAGISVSAGIPDFRSSNGLFASTKNQHKLKASGKHLFDASVYKHEDSTQSFHTMVRGMADMTRNAKPTPFHHLLASLAQEGRLLRLYSQNIDCLDTTMKPLSTNVPLNPKGPWPTTVQLHGGLQKMVCTKCANIEAFDGKLFDGPQAPLCGACQIDDQVRTAHAGKRSHGIGRLRPRFVLYNEFNPDEEAIGNVSSADLKARPDAVIVVGTTLKVPGTRRLVKELCQVTRGRKDGFTAWINIDGEPKGVEFKDCWDLVVRSKCDNVARLAALPPWDCDIGDDYLVSEEQDDESQERLSKTTLEVSIRSSPATSPAPEARPKQLEAVQTMPTPRPSPKPPSAKPAKTAKPKQSKLPFDQTDKVKPEKPAKVSKPRARKPKQPAKAKQAPGSTVMQTFKAVKNVPAQDEVVKKLGSPASEPLEGKQDVAASLPALRPERRNSNRTPLYQSETSEEPGAEPDSGPPTPALPERCPSKETISPKSAPRDLLMLIDM